MSVPPRPSRAFPLVSAVVWLAPHLAGALLASSWKAAILSTVMSFAWAWKWRKPLHSDFLGIDRWSVAFGFAVWLPFQSFWIGVFATTAATIATTLYAFRKAYASTWRVPGGAAAIATTETRWLSKRLLVTYVGLVLAPLAVNVSHPNDRFLPFARDLYENVMRRPGTVTEVQALAGELSTGGDPFDVVMKFLKSDEARRTLAAEWHVTHFGSPMPLEYWKTQDIVVKMAASMVNNDPRRVLGAAMSGGFYFNSMGGTEPGFWQAFSMAILGRVFDQNGLDHHMKLAEKETKRKIVDWFVQCDDANLIHAARWHKDMLGRKEPIQTLVRMPEVKRWATRLDKGYYPTLAEFHIAQNQIMTASSYFWPRLVVCVLALIACLFCHVGIATVRRAFT